MDVLRESCDVDGVVVLGASVDLAEVLVTLDLVLVKVQFNHGCKSFCVG